ncbi:MAG: DUF1080 domain-containing protein [Bryobacterales bacterium]|nr:DUF1080 domain-containing protein [Bryobacterales bacterium]
MKYTLFVLLFFFCIGANAEDGFVSLMPKRDIAEHWTAEGKAPAEAWSVRDGVIACTGQPNGFLRSRKKYRNFILRAEWRFQEGFPHGAGDDAWPNAGFFIHAGEVKDGWPTSLEVQGYFGEAGSLFGVRGGDRWPSLDPSSPIGLASAHGTAMRSFPKMATLR